MHVLHLALTLNWVSLGLAWVGLGWLGPAWLLPQPQTKPIRAAKLTPPLPMPSPILQ